MGKEGKAARRRLRGNLRTRALENSIGECTRTRKFRQAILLLFPKCFSNRSPRAEGRSNITRRYFGLLPLRASQRSHSISGKLRPPFPRNALTEVRYSIMLR